MMKDSSIKVSVLCTAYNHEPYIKKCLEGFVNQKTNFKFEVLINDDHSTDHTPDIIREYEEKYPYIIRGFYQPHNLYSQRINIQKNILLPKARGKYIAICEGDDYWTDPYKLQKQYDALEINKECHICTHSVELINESGELLNKCIPSQHINGNLLTSDQVLNEMAKDYSFHTSSYFFDAEMYRAYWRQDLDFRTNADVGDGPILFYFSTMGEMYFFNECMSRYRVGSIGSWGQRTVGEKRKYHHLHMIESIRSFDEYSNYKYSSILKRYIFRHELPIIQYDCQYAKLLGDEYKPYFSHLPARYKLCAYMDRMFPIVFRYFLKKRRKMQEIQ